MPILLKDDKGSTFRISGRFATPLRVWSEGYAHPIPLAFHSVSNTDPIFSLSASKIAPEPRVLVMLAIPGKFL